MKKTRPVREKLMGRCFLPARVGIFPFINIMSKLLFPTCTLIWRVSNYVSHQGESINRRNKNTPIFNIARFALINAISLFDSVDFYWLKAFSSIKKKLDIVALKNLFLKYKIILSSPPLNMFPLKRWQRWETSDCWQLCQGKYKKTLETASHRTHLFLESPRNISRRFLRRLEAGSLKNCPRN